MSDKPFEIHRSPVFKVRNNLLPVKRDATANDYVAADGVWQAAPTYHGVEVAPRKTLKTVKPERSSAMMSHELIRWEFGSISGSLVDGINYYFCGALMPSAEGTRAHWPDVLMRWFQISGDYSPRDTRYQFTIYD